MENQAPTAASQLMAEPERPQTLRVLCILSFISCGIMLLLYGIGSFLLSLDETTVGTFWGKVVESNPSLENVDPMEFFHTMGMACVYGLIATIFSLIGVIMMWRLERIGFFLYTVAELATHFVPSKVEGMESGSAVGTVIFVALDLLFIILYFTQLKFMHRKTNNNYVQGGS